jgi:hypothetical protein
VVTNYLTSAYIVDGQTNPTLTMTRGETYIFRISAPGHPMFFKTAPALGFTNAYYLGVTNNGIDNGVISIVVPATAPSTLYYQCQYHGAMNGKIIIRGQS